MKAGNNGSVVHMVVSVVCPSAETGVPVVSSKTGATFIKHARPDVPNGARRNSPGKPADHRHARAAPWRPVMHVKGVPVKSMT